MNALTRLHANRFDAQTQTDWKSKPEHIEQKSDTNDRKLEVLAYETHTICLNKQTQQTQQQ